MEAGYNDLTYINNFASSSAIRNIVQQNNDLHVMENLMPAKSYNTLIENIQMKHIIPDISIFEKEIIYTLRKMSVSEIAELPDVTEGLESAIKNAANSCNTMSDLLDHLKTKRYASTRLQRILLYTLLGITKKDIAMSKKTQPYVRVLGFNTKGKFLISEIVKNNPKLEIVTSVKRFTEKNNNKSLKQMLDKDILATDIYTLGYRGSSWSNLDFTNKIVTLK